MCFIFYGLLYNSRFEIKKLHKEIGFLNKTQQIMQQGNVFYICWYVASPSNLNENDGEIGRAHV